MSPADPTTSAAGPQVAGEAAADRLMRALDYRLNPAIQRLDRAQVAVVLHALADHTALEAAREHRYDESGPWPRSLSIGRWLHDVADQLGRDDPLLDDIAEYAMQRGLERDVDAIVISETTS